MATETDKSPFSVQQEKSMGVLISKQPRSSAVFIAQVSLRILAILLALAAISVIVTDKQTITLFGFQLKSRYSYSSAFRFLLGADAVLCVSSALSLIFLYGLYLKRSEPETESQLPKFFYLFVHDTVMLVLVVAGCAAASAIGYVGRHGEPHMTWQAVCKQVPKFCNKMMVGLLLSYMAFFAYFLLTLLSAHRLMTRSTHWAQLRPTQSQNSSH
ncbi:Casparian strip membrane protein [Trema orientale]|uniref:CASP-like protein n=1 Tax=Trema orientale TaxID=63057 RepID=A0A2P5FCC1_TREOI|nr:Casparian strip membrane protein [Trema orientale]